MSQPTEQPTEPTTEEIQVASAQENQAYQASQLGYLQDRVARLRIELNRSVTRVAELEARLAEYEPQAEEPVEDPVQGENVEGNPA